MLDTRTLSMFHVPRSICQRGDEGRKPLLVETYVQKACAGRAMFNSGDLDLSGASEQCVLQAYPTLP